jgi:hypothetical protein
MIFIDNFLSGVIVTGTMIPTFSIYPDPLTTFCVSYDRISQSINAYFCGPNNRDLTPHEGEAMKLIGERFSAKSQQFLCVAATKEMFYGLKSLCQNIIEQAYYETGVKFDLDTNSIDEFLGIPRFSHYDQIGRKPTTSVVG